MLLQFGLSFCLSVYLSVTAASHVKTTQLCNIVRLFSRRGSPLTKDRYPRPTRVWLAILTESEVMNMKLVWYGMTGVSK